MNTYTNWKALSGNPNFLLLPECFNWLMILMTHDTPSQRLINFDCFLTIARLIFFEVFLTWPYFSIHCLSFYFTCPVSTNVNSLKYCHNYYILVTNRIISNDDNIRPKYNVIIEIISCLKQTSFKIGKA